MSTACPSPSRRPSRWRVAAVGIALASLVSQPRPALAWGEEGHAIIAEIAEFGLTPAARATVQRLLALDGKTSLEQVASWADYYRLTHLETGRFHVVNIPIGSAGYEQSRDCASGCLLSKLAEETGQLRTGPRADPQRQLEALKWVTHLVGDATQPLHCANNDDYGGNDIPFGRFADGSVPPGRVSLHSLWDTDLLVHHDGLNARAIAARLARAIGPVEIADAAAGGPVDWVTQSWRLAGNVAYRFPHTGELVNLDAAYEHVAIATIERQLTRAGIRLANLLNAQLGNLTR